MKPFLTLNFCIAMIGIFPSQNSPVSSGIIMGAEAFVAQTTIVAFNFAPKGYAMCNGQLLPISQNTALFSLLGTIYGGNGQSNFALPDFRGRLGIQQGQGPGLSPYDLGQTGGVEQVTLTVSEIPQHSHQFMVGSNAVSDSPDGNYFASFPMAYTSASPNVTLNAGAITSAGGGLPHNNIMPSIGLNFIIATEGEFPQRP